jgi:hypothetical protein
MLAVRRDGRASTILYSRLPLAAVGTTALAQTATTLRRIDAAARDLTAPPGLLGTQHRDPKRKGWPSIHTLGCCQERILHTNSVSAPHGISN